MYSWLFYLVCLVEMDLRDVRCSDSEEGVGVESGTMYGMVQWLRTMLVGRIRGGWLDTYSMAWLWD